MLGRDIIFIDKQIGTPVYPSELWFDDGSIGKYHIKQLFFISRLTSVQVAMEGNPVMFLLDMKKFEPDRGINDPDYKLKTHSMKAVGEKISDEWYLFSVYVVAECDSAGSYKVDLYFDKDKISIGVDLYGEREEYAILLHNQGMDLPKDIVRVFPETDIHDSAIDWLLLNRKYKELLLNAVDIIYRKGSYKSLQDSLNWFEYGDMVKLKEFWSTPSMVKLYEKDLTMEYSDALKHIMEMYMKTTFIAITLTPDLIKTVDDKVEYDQDRGESTVPLLEEQELRWGLDDMMLKMTLLGNYFSTFFMPLHLDLLYSSLERLVFTTPAKGKTIHEGERLGDDLCDSGWRVKISDVYDEYVIGDAYCSATDNTPLMTEDGMFGAQLLDEITPPETYRNCDEETGEWSTSFSNNLNIGSYAVVPMTIEVVGPMKRDFCTLCVTVNGTSTISSPVSLSTGDRLGVNILIKSAGVYVVGLNLLSTEGMSITGSVKLSVMTPESNHFEFTPMMYDHPKTIDYDTIESRSPMGMFIDETVCNLMYPQQIKNMVFPFMLSSDEGIDITIDGIKLNFSSPTDINSRLKDTCYVLWFDTDVPNTFRVYIIYKEPGKEDCDIDVSDVKGKMRFVPFLWVEDPDSDPRRLNGPVRFTPQDHLVRNGEGNYSWIITNESLDEKGYVSGSASPIVVGLNKGKMSPGIYSVELCVKYGDVEVHHKRKNIFRIVSVE